MAAEDVSLPAMGPSAEFLSYRGTTTPLSMTVRQSEHAVVVIQVAGELDMSTGPALNEQLRNLLSVRPDRLVIDLSEVTFLGSSGLAVLVGARDTAAAQGTRLQLSGISHRGVARPLQITGLDRLFETSPPANG